MLYDIGLKVTITNTNPRSNKSTLYGHTCRIKRVIHFVEGDSYILDWNAEDNPGQECNLPMRAVSWDECDFYVIPYPELVVHSSGLPDI